MAIYNGTVYRQETVLATYSVDVEADSEEEAEEKMLNDEWLSHEIKGEEIESIEHVDIHDVRLIRP